MIPKKRYKFGPNRTIVEIEPPPIVGELKPVGVIGDPLITPMSILVVEDKASAKKQKKAL